MFLHLFSRALGIRTPLQLSPGCFREGWLWGFGTLTCVTLHDSYWRALNPLPHCSHGTCCGVVFISWVGSINSDLSTMSHRTSQLNHLPGLACDFETFIVFGKNSVKEEIRTKYFYFMVVANCNANCYWLLLLLFFFYQDSRLVLSRHGRLHAVTFETNSRDTQTLNLSRNMSKFYAWQVGSRMHKQQSQNLVLSTIRNKKVEHARRETRNIMYWYCADLFYCCQVTLGHAQRFQDTSAKLRVFVSNISSLPSVKAAIYEIRVFVSRISPPVEHSARY